MCEFQRKSLFRPVSIVRNPLVVKRLPSGAAPVNILFVSFNLFFLWNPVRNGEYGEVFGAASGRESREARSPTGDKAVTDNEAVQLWSAASKHLQAVLPSDIYARWIEVIQPAGFSDGKLMLAVDNDFYQTWLEEHYLPMIRDAVASAHGAELTIMFKVESQRPRPPAPTPEPRRSLRDYLGQRGRGEAASSPLNPKFTFDTFVIGPSNNFAHAASMAVAQAPARAYNPLFIYGGTGLGKTHLMQAIGHHVLSNSRASVYYLSSESLLNEYIHALQERTLIQFRKKYRSVDLLLIDDIHFLAGKERLQEEFFHTFNALFDAHKQIVMTSDRPASEITGLEQRLVSRFEWGLVTELEAPDLETRIAILRNKQAAATTKLPDNLLVFIAENIRSNVRRLEGALVRSISYASLTRQPLTVESLKYLLRDSLTQEKQSELTFDSIQRAVAEHFDVRLTDMSSKRRPRDVAVPRQVAMYLCRKMTRSSFPEIANAFSKTHATVLHACRVIDSRMDVDSELKDHVGTISQKLGRLQP
jgi:chromosomal replication initiator protein